jgi:molybdate transport system ATP-binding protein
MLEVNIKKSLHSFNLSSSFSAQNEILGMLGPSGCGKSMTLKCIAGLQIPTAGHITLNGRTLFDSKKKINVPPRLRKIGYVFQNYALFPHLTVAQNIAYGISHLNKTSQKQLVMNMIDRMNLTGLENRYPHQLSGGQQQRVALARTLITEPELLLLDEPFSALDAHVKGQLEQELIRIIYDNYKGTILLVTHNLEEAYKLCDRILMYDKGKTVQLGKKDEIIHHPINLTAAKIIGCKNLIPVNVKENQDNILELSSNKQFMLMANNKKNRYDNRMIAGFHSYHLKLKTTCKNELNTFPCQFINQIQSIFSMVVQVACKGQVIEIEMTKEEWNKLNDSKYDQLYVQIPAEHIFLVPYEK